MGIGKKTWMARSARCGADMVASSKNGRSSPSLVACSTARCVCVCVCVCVGVC